MNMIHAAQSTGVAMGAAMSSAFEARFTTHIQKTVSEFLGEDVFIFEALIFPEPQGDLAIAAGIAGEDAGESAGMAFAEEFRYWSRSYWNLHEQAKMAHLEWRARYERAVLDWFRRARSVNDTFYRWREQMLKDKFEFYQVPKRWEADWFESLRKIKYGDLPVRDAPVFKGEW